MTDMSPFDSIALVGRAAPEAAGIRGRHTRRAGALAVGIHRGPELSSRIGSRERREHECFGHAVNTAAGRRSLTRTNKPDILVATAMRAEVGNPFEEQAIPPEQVKCSDEPVARWPWSGRPRNARERARSMSHRPSESVLPSKPISPPDHARPGRAVITRLVLAPAMRKHASSSRST